MAGIDEQALIELRRNAENTVIELTHNWGTDNYDLGAGYGHIAIEVDDVYAAAAECHRICGPNHVVGTGCEVAPETPPENLRALVAYARDHAPHDVSIGQTPG